MSTTVDCIKKVVIKVICEILNLRNSPKNENETETLLNTDIRAIIDDAPESVKKRRAENLRLALRKYLKTDCGADSTITPDWFINNQDKTLKDLIWYLAEQLEVEGSS